MPKQKTRKATKKRFRITKTGKIMRRKGGKGHLLTGKTKKRKRALRRSDLVAKADHRKISRLLPYA
ncbi:MAG: 50S ribosomal protein L35 [Candidatus Omnitrophota bacterium]|jgi:large subunit ribosomal protein L35